MLSWRNPSKTFRPLLYRDIIYSLSASECYQFHENNIPLNKIIKFGQFFFRQSPECVCICVWWKIAKIHACKWLRARRSHVNKLPKNFWIVCSVYAVNIRFVRFIIVTVAVRVRVSDCEYSAFTVCSIYSKLSLRHGAKFNPINKLT